MDRREVSHADRPKPRFHRPKDGGMSVLLTGPNHEIMLAAPGRPVLFGPLAATVPDGPSDLSSIAGLTGWWDASGPSGLRDTAGAPVSASGAQVGAVSDKSHAGTPLTVWHAASGASAMPPLATPRLNGLLGGLGRNMVVPPQVPRSDQQLPIMDPDQGLISGALSLGSDAPWTILLVWSRPNWRQTGSGPNTLLSIAGTKMLAADNREGTHRLVLFPGVSQTVLTGTLQRRHTHAVVLRNTPGMGVDVWLDGAQLATVAANPMAATVTGPLLFLHDGTTGGGAECWFHEAALWTSAADSNGIAAIQSHLGRWVLGARKGIQVLVTGQSNAGNGLNDGAWHLLAQGVAWHLGALAYGVVGNYGGPPSATCIHGEGIYPLPALGFGGSFLLDPGDGTDPSTWTLGADGSAVRNWIQSNTDPADAADIAVILWPWSEDDSARQYSEKAAYESAARRFLALERGMLSRSAASLPQAWWSAIPFAYGNNDPGTQMQREVVAEMAADPAQNVSVVLPQTADSLPRGPTTYDPTTGLWTGGDWLHRDAVDNLRFGRLAAPLVARAVLASSGGDTLTSIPDGVPASGGPVVTHVYRQSATSLIVTIRHDSGTDLIVPATQAANGVGWAVLDGGSVATPAQVVTALACARLNATQLLITLSRSLVNPSAACRLFYPYGTATIGRGNVVTDNFSRLAPPDGWNIAADLGAGWRPDMPLRVPMMAVSGVVLSDVP
jgi:hypothetical protein